MWFGSGIGGRRRDKPLSWSMVVVIMKKQSRRNAISAVELEFTSGVFLAIINLYYLRVAPTIQPVMSAAIVAPNIRYVR